MKDLPKDIVTRARSLHGAQRDQYLQEACGDDLRRLRIVRQLLTEAETIASDPIESGRRRDPSDAAHAQLMEQEWIGHFRILGELGSGAMGVVMLAEQQTPKRQVALKVLRPEVMNPVREKRFEIETESLALLKHPGIATIYESGRAEIEGRWHPYFAMELVVGRAFDAYGAGVDPRLRLGKMISICEAVDHAHRRGVLHRDLKPANILVDEAGRAKVLDFGVAKLAESDAQVPDLVGTLPYMSPEQLRGDERVDGRTDVYALGVILHEILIGRRPHDLHGLTIDDALRIVTHRAWTPARSDQKLGGELGAIVARAIHPDADERYGTALELGDDIRRYLKGEPVLAVGGGAGYRARKFVGRNRGLVLLGALTALAIAAGVAGVSWQAARATRGWHEATVEKQRAQNALAHAESERRRAVAINLFMINMLVSADPESSLGADLTVREVLDTAALTIDTEFSDQPEIHVGVRMALTNTYLGLGEIKAAHEHARRMLEVSRDAFGENDALTADAKRTLALVLAELGEYEKATTLIEEARRVVDTLDQPIESAKILSELARVYHGSGRQEEALALWTRSQELLGALLGPDDKETLIVMHNRGMALKDLGQLKESETVLSDVYQIRQRVFGDDHPQTLAALSVLAGVIQKEGRNEEASMMLRDVLERRTRVLGPDHFATLISKGNLGVTLILMGGLEEAEELTREALEGYRARFGDTHSRTLILKANLAYLLEERGEIDEAARLYRETIDARRDAEGGLDPETWAPMNNLAMLLMSHDRADEARPLFVELLAMCDALLPADHYYTAIFRNNFGECLMLLGEHEAAMRALTETEPVLVRVFGEQSERVLKSQQRRARLGRLMRSGG